MNQIKALPPLEDVEKDATSDLQGRTSQANQELHRSLSSLDQDASMTSGQGEGMMISEDTAAAFEKDVEMGE